MPEVIINGPEGRIEGRYSQGATKGGPAALFLHPDPRHGGTMNNRVIYDTYHLFAKRGFSCLRFNFRGVGRSQGTFSRGEGELSDAATALDWLQNSNQTSRDFWVVGFSFGSWIGMQLLMRRPELVGFVAVAPPASMYDFSFLAPCPSSGLLIHGGDDKHVPQDHVARLVERLRQQKTVAIDFAVVRGADHFFSERGEELKQGIAAYLDKRLDDGAKPAKAAAQA